jgi:predicted nucleic acid-binding protein
MVLPSVPVDALTGPRRSLDALEGAVAAGHVLAASTLVLSEWLRGPRTPDELSHQELLPPGVDARAFGGPEAETAARISRSVKRPRGRDMDIAITASAIEQGARLWSLNPADFRDIPGLQLFDPA